MSSGLVRQITWRPSRKAGTELSSAEATEFVYREESLDHSRWTPFAIAGGVGVAGVLVGLALDATVTRWLAFAAVTAAVAAGVAAQLLRRHNAKLDANNQKTVSEILRRG